MCEGPHLCLTRILRWHLRNWWHIHRFTEPLHIMALISLCSLAHVSLLIQNYLLDAHSVFFAAVQNKQAHKSATRRMLLTPPEQRRKHEPSRATHQCESSTEKDHKNYEKSSHQHTSGVSASHGPLRPQLKACLRTLMSLCARTPAMPRPSMPTSPRRAKAHWNSPSFTAWPGPWHGCDLFGIPSCGA